MTGRSQTSFRIHFINVTSTDSVSISHSSKESKEDECMMMTKVQVKIGSHLYESSFISADTRYGIILG